MNKNILYYLLAIILVASCKRDEDHVFEKSPDERINETLNDLPGGHDQFSIWLEW